MIDPHFGYITKFTKFTKCLLTIWVSSESWCSHWFFAVWQIFYLQLQIPWLTRVDIRLLTLDFQHWPPSKFKADQVGQHDIFSTKIQIYDLLGIADRKNLTFPTQNRRAQKYGSLVLVHSTPHRCFTTIAKWRLPLVERIVLCVYGLGLTLPVRVNAIMKFINTLSMCIRSIYVGVCVKLCKFI
jgi:hypothetical protein